MYLNRVHTHTQIQILDMKTDVICSLGPFILGASFLLIFSLLYEITITMYHNRTLKNLLLANEKNYLKKITK